MWLHGSLGVCCFRSLLAPLGEVTTEAVSPPLALWHCSWGGWRGGSSAWTLIPTRATTAPAFGEVLAGASPRGHAHSAHAADPTWPLEESGTRQFTD